MPLLFLCFQNIYPKPIYAKRVYIYINNIVYLYLKKTIIYRLLINNILSYKNIYICVPLIIFLFQFYIIEFINKN